ncbi:hypothetical protein ACFOD4_13925 [Pseudoroseomonas globiformis]|uniref:DUF58 domain-containing protein n=1 Tax=Teichococcus globiformis TaxID=2307229 RepID=A0ABV7G7G0_9PROT
MPQSPFRRLPALAVLTSAGLGYRFGAMPELALPSGWTMLLLGGGGAAAWLLLRRPARALPTLRLELRSVPPRHSLQDVLRFVGSAPLAWSARRGEWSLDLDGNGPAELPWRLELRHPEAPSMPLARAATLEAVLNASRRLYATREAATPGAAPAHREAGQMLGCDLEFDLPSPRRCITALAEGGFALLDDTGYRALSPPTANALLGEAGRLHGARP